MEKRFETPGTVRLYVRVPVGSVALEAGESDVTEVRLTALGGDRDIEEVRVEAHGNEVAVEVSRGSRWLRRPPCVELVVRCPQGTHLDIGTFHASVTAHGRFGPVRVKSVSGDVRLAEIDGGCVESSSGTVAVSRVTGRLEGKTVSGDLRVGSAASVKAKSVSGDISIGAVAAGEVELRSVSGDLELGILRGSRLSIDAQSVSGDIDSELPVSPVPGEDERPIVELRANTVSGDLRIVRAAAGEPDGVPAAIA